ncbi:hypothetical protein [Salinigranum salinum]|uniref:hypothetical protein n=1 Tax=Salinigranum salinum TaxID=1364937 RepID=UPI00195B7F95|nr:hypothetical protein [Salinigranum salinum]
MGLTLVQPLPLHALLPGGQSPLPPDPTGVALTASPLTLTSLAVRWLHVLAATVAVGGSVLTWVLLRIDLGSPGPPDAPPAVVTVARTYEWLFWAAVGTLVMTGVGNLGAFAPTLPGGRWRTTLDVKLGLFVVVLVASVVRLRLLARLPPSPDPATKWTLRRAYGATAVGLVALLTLAAVLAHG